MRRSRERCPARSWRVSQTRRWLAYREVRRRPARAAARAPRGAAVRTGPKGGAKIPPGSWVREHFSPVRKNGPVQTKHRGGAPVGAAAPVWAAGSPSQGEHVEGAPSGAPLPLSYGESEERTRRCAPASVERGGGAMEFLSLPLVGRVDASGSERPGGARSCTNIPPPASPLRGSAPSPQGGGIRSVAV